jgi:hypothetical protein
MSRLEETVFLCPSWELGHDRQNVLDQRLLNKGQVYTEFKLERGLGPGNTEINIQGLCLQS